MGISPIISVVMAVHNGEKYLRASVDSILAQSFGDFEFIIIDDGSTDGSLSILNSYGDPRIRVISRENKGLTKSLNEGIRLARGEFLARMDGDDISLPRRFEKQLEMFRRDSELVAVGGLVERIGEQDQPLTSPPMPMTHEQIEADLLLGKGGALVHPAMMARAAALGDIGGYREQFKTAQDLDLYLRLARRGKLGNVLEIVLKYRIHGNSVSAARREQQDRDVESILRDAYAARNLPLPRAVVRRRYELTIRRYEREFWSVWHSHHRAAAARLALRVIRKTPLRIDSWMLLAYAVAGRPPANSGHAAEQT